jgi:F-type H+-transporting ATPase subunit delta
MSDTNIASRYAKAIFTIADERQMKDKIDEELQLIRESLTTSTELRTWLSYPTVDALRKKELLYTVFVELSEPVQNLLLLLVDRQRTDILPEVAEIYHQLNDESQAKAVALVTSAFPLQEEDEKQLIKTFEYITKKRIYLRKQVDSDLLGGVVVKIGDRVYDGSLRGKLNRFQDDLQRSKVQRLG